MPIAGLLGIITVAGTWLLRTVVTATLAKLLIGGVIALLIKELAPWLLNLLPTGDFGLAGSMAGFTPAMWYFYDYFMVGFGLHIILTASVTRFVIRRIPFFG